MQNKLFETMYNSVKNKLVFALTLTDGDMELAIEYVKKQTTAGPKVWQAVLADID